MGAERKPREIWEPARYTCAFGDLDFAVGVGVEKRKKILDLRGILF